MTEKNSGRCASKVITTFGLQNKPCSVCKGGVRKVVRPSHVPAYTQG